ncbi:hypothetical protein BGZ74_004136 [Mortierella antarctica]|nr:hypothetical protein BGZ74_004136 [Mortierella antarctica]
MPKSKGPAKGFYAVHVGKTKGIYFTWPECEKQIKGVVGAKFKKFDNLKDAEVFVKEGPQQFTKPVKPKVVVGGLKVIKGTTPYDRPDPSSSSSSLRSTTKDHFVRVNGVRVAASDSIVVYTDGSSRGNGQQGCQAGLGVFFGVNDPRNVSERLAGEPQTNQRAELTAALRALEVCGSDTKPLEIRTDSMYTINIVTQWGEGWSKNGWKKSDGAAVMNRDIIEPLLDRVRNRPGPIKWTHVKAHVGTFGNEMADKLANSGALMPQPSSRS